MQNKTTKTLILQKYRYAGLKGNIRKDNNIIKYLKCLETTYFYFILKCWKAE